MAFIYFIAARLGLYHAEVQENISLIWPATGIAISGLLLYGYRLWPGIFIGAFLAAYTIGSPISFSFMIAIGNSFEALTAFYLLSKFNCFKEPSYKIRDILGLIFFAVILSSTVSATVGVTALCLHSMIDWSVFKVHWLQWWLGDAMGALIITPLLMVWLRKRISKRFDFKSWEVIAYLFLLISTCLILFGKTDNPSHLFEYHRDNITYLVFPLLLWSAFRYGFRGTTLSILIVACAVLLGTVYEFSPFMGDSQIETLFLNSVFLSILAMTSLLLTAVVDEREQVELMLRSSEEKYRQIVEDTNVLTWEADIETVQFTYMSPQAEKITGYTSEEWCQPGFWAKNIYAKDRAWAMSYCQECTEKLEDHVFEYRFVKSDGNIIWFYDNVKIVNDEQGIPRQLRGIMIDITERKRVDEQLTYQASHDVLTGLVNRREFEQRAERLLAAARLDKDEHAMCYMDLDQFKLINDTCGHIAGDEMLRQLSSVLSNVIRHQDTLARLGGDEFGVLMEHCLLDDAHRVATSLLKTIQDYNFVWEEHTFKVGVSIGLVALTDATANLTELLKDADAACYMAKDKGRNRIHIYHAEDKEIAQRHGEMLWVTRLMQALEDDRFLLYAQAIIPLDNRIDEHYELLIRLQDEDKSIIPPGAFLPAAERYDLISKIDRWVIEHSFNLLAEHPDFLKHVNFISINLSGRSITDPEMLEFIIKHFDISGIEGNKICFEVTETAAISNLSSAMKFISTLKELNCRFALDDFGSGLSSFAYLKNLSVDFLKIDGVFVKDIVSDPIDYAMVKSINEIGQVMGMQTIAEFVENEDIKSMLKNIGVDYAQGYGIGKPSLFDDILEKAKDIALQK